MLSRVAERLYWMSRYVERAENTARMINSFNVMSLDMPRSVQLSWRGLVSVTGTDAIFNEHYQREDERNCVKFLIADTDNHSSVLSSLRAARENVRTTRDLVPTEAWEVVNELYIFARDNVESGINKRSRFDFLSEIVQRCQTFGGLLAGCMSHDSAFDFIRLGRSIERADMTSRQVDAGAVQLLIAKDNPQPHDGLLWTTVLRAQSGFQMYRQHVKRRINGVDVVRFLLQDTLFPRAVAHSVAQAEAAIGRLPHNDIPLRLAVQARRHVLEADVEKLIAAEQLHDYIDVVQSEIGDIHNAVAACWFPQVAEVA